jgi:hypothetical protein
MLFGAFFGTVDIIGTVVATVAVLVALVAIGISVHFGRDTATKLADSVLALSKVVGLTQIAAAEAERSRLVAEIDRSLVRVEEIGRLVEQVFWDAQPTEDPQAYIAARNNLAIAIIGWENHLTLSASVLKSINRDDAMNRASQARGEIQNEIKHLNIQKGLQERRFADLAPKSLDKRIGSS